MRILLETIRELRQPHIMGSIDAYAYKRYYLGGLNLVLMIADELDRLLGFPSWELLCT